MFKDRLDAGLKLADKLKEYIRGDVVVYALPRGGVVVGSEVAKKLHAPLDLIITRKIGHPTTPEYAIGAVAENGHSVMDVDVGPDIDKDYLKSQIGIQMKEARRRRQLYLAGRKRISCEGKVAIVVDDGIATGLTMKAAIQELKLHYNPKKIVVTIPVAPDETAKELEAMGVEVVTIKRPVEFLGAVGSYFEDFPQVSDEEVIRHLQNANNLQ